jgi:GT2 family glycosyltransferase
MASDRNGKPPVLIVMLNWNSPEETITAVESVLKMDYPNYEIFLIDSGSADDSVAELRKITTSSIQLLESPVNVGYTGGCNLGLQRGVEVGAKYVWLLNNDAVVGPETLSSIVALAESDPAIGLVTPVIASLDEVPHITFAGGVCSIKEALYDETNDLEQARRWAVEYPKDGLVIGTAMLVSTRLIREIGVLEPSFFAYYEDIDYCARSSGAGYRNVVDTASMVYHFEKNRNTKPFEIRPHYWYYMARNEGRFWRKHLGLVRGLKQTWTSSNAFLRHRNRVNSLPASSDAILAGLWHGWWNRGGPYHPSFRMPGVVAWMVKLYGRRASLQPAAYSVEQSQIVPER